MVSASVYNGVKEISKTLAKEGHQERVVFFIFLSVSTRCWGVLSKLSIFYSVSLLSSQTKMICRAPQDIRKVGWGNVRPV